jgi:hypothetical protein
MPFRFAAKTVFLTYPQCPIPVSDALVLLKTKMGEDDGTHYVVGQEHHADGNLHLHVFCERKVKIDTARQDYFDLQWSATGGADAPVVQVYHPNVQVPKDRAAVLDYVTKYGTVGVWPESFDYQRVIAHGTKRKGKWELATPFLLEGKTTVELLELMPSFTLANKRVVADAVAFVKQVRSNAAVPGVTDFLNWDLPPDSVLFNVRLFQGVWKLLRDSLANPEFGKRQLYLYGPTGIGKTYFLQLLTKCVRVYNLPTGEDFYDQYQDELFDLAVIEEFKSQKTIQWLNQWLDGAQMNLRQKGCQYFKTKSIPTLIFSNFDPMGSAIYPNMQESTSIETFRRRLIPIPVDRPLMWALSSALRLFLQIPEANPFPITVPLVESLIVGGILPGVVLPMPAIPIMNPLYQAQQEDL